MAAPRTMTASQRLKIAVASSGLGHIRRGVETWADDLGKALQRSGAEVAIFQGSAHPEINHTVVPCWRRFDSRTERLVERLRRLGGWRFGFGSGYEAEQTTFAFALWRRIRNTHDILHVQDPLVALIFERLHRLHLSRPRVILAHGTEEGTATLQKFSFLQHLAPSYLEYWRQYQPAHQLAFVIPNPVDVIRFQPGDRSALRAAYDLPADALIVISVGAIKSSHKRMDYVIREFSAWRANQPGETLLLIAGATELETGEIRVLAQQLAPDAIRIMADLPRDQLADLLSASDIFTLASLHEMLGTAILEAMASGLPIACNDTAIFRWVVGDAGCLNDLSQSGALAAQLSTLAVPVHRQQYATAARRRAKTLFSEEVVVRQVLAMYQQVMDSKDR